MAPPALGDGWKTESLVQAGIDRKRIEAMTDSIRAHPEFAPAPVLVVMAFLSMLLADRPAV